MSDDPGDISDKAALRILARQRRRAFMAGLDPLAHRLAFKVLPSPLARRLEGTRTVALYIGIEDEAPAQRLAPKLIDMGKTVALPRVIDRMGSMEFLPWHPDAPLLPGPFGTRHPERGEGPVSPDAIIAPLLGFDRAMNRMGQGGGYYDRAFARHPDALRIGLAWSAQEQDMIPADPWDLPLHMIMTEVELIEGNEP
ncbi:MAG: 5-formyltetrahydrofolate cyclo-ligase [Sphingobium sp.]